MCVLFIWQRYTNYCMSQLNTAAVDMDKPYSAKPKLSS
ncbi:hypothetical protein PRUB_a1833 [Pseudoalteromonas rubra]|uniref:Uncharacterized protein n=1 Tax=Pseudoalteromonas rubra TaxID=43658 RepID=A0A8T0CG49_9GAMM|nr:hypothetical protein PRUB_a1833 [Pseudoalteromonas rubra]